MGMRSVLPLSSWISPRSNAALGRVGSRFRSLLRANWSHNHDTQMTLFTAEGLLRAAVRYPGRGICNTPSLVHHAYMRWLKTQGFSRGQLESEIGMDGWLIRVRPLWTNRAPGNLRYGAAQRHTAGRICNERQQRLRRLDEGSASRIVGESRKYIRAWK